MNQTLKLTNLRQMTFSQQFNSMKNLSLTKMSPYVEIFEYLIFKKTSKIMMNSRCPSLQGFSKTAHAASVLQLA